MLRLIHLVFAPSFGCLKCGEEGQEKVVDVVGGCTHAHTDRYRKEETRKKEARAVTTQNSPARPDQAA